MVIEQGLSNPLPPTAVSSSSSEGFPSPIIISPKSSTHESTIIFLHGRGQTAQYFHGPFLSTQVPSRTITFRDAFPDTKFVFPTAPLMRATKYRRSLIHQWYDGSGDWEPEALGNMRGSVKHVHGLIRGEVELLGGDSRKVVLAGFSQGCAMALVSYLLWNGDPLGAVVGMSGFLPLNAHMSELLDETSASNGDEDCGFTFGSDMSDSTSVTGGDADEENSPLQRTIMALREEVELPALKLSSSFLHTPVFLGHGTEDPEVNHNHGHLAAQLLEKMGIETEFHTYEGLDHAYSENMLDDATSFLESHMRRCPNTTKHNELTRG